METKYRVVVITPDGERDVEPHGDSGPIYRTKAEAWQIACRMTDIAVRRGWRLSYGIKEA